MADQEKIAELIGKFSANFSEKQKAMRELAAIGEDAVPALVDLIEKRSPRLGEAVQTLGKMGASARGALPQIKELLAGKIKPPEGWTWNTSPQLLTLSEAKNMGWAAEELVPIVYGIASDEKAGNDARTRAMLHIHPNILSIDRGRIFSPAKGGKQ